jgi:hypothetical protein
LPWIEIDFPEDYHRAVREVLPQVDFDRAGHSNVTAWDGLSERRAARADRRGLALARHSGDVRHELRLLIWRMAPRW